MNGIDDERFGIAYMILGAIVYILGFIVISEIICPADLPIGDVFGLAVVTVGLVLILFGWNKLSISKVKDRLSIIEGRMDHLEDATTSKEFNEPEDPKELDAIMGRG